MKKRVLCFGDSITWGFIAGTNFERYDENTRFPCVIQNDLGSNYTVIEEGFCGRTTVWFDPVEQRMSGLDYFRPCLDTCSPVDLVIIMLGTNDTKSHFSATVDNITSSVALIADYAQKSPYGPVYGQPPQVLIVSPPVIENPLFMGLFEEKSEKLTQLFAEAFKRKADEIGVHYFDAASCAKADPNDGVHITRESHIALGHALAAKVREIIG